MISNESDIVPFTNSYLAFHSEQDYRFLTDTTPLEKSFLVSTDANQRIDGSTPAFGRLYEEEFLEIPTFRMCFTACYVILITVAALGNLFLIIYVCKTANFSTASPIFILSLAICDFFRSAILTPMKFLEFLNLKRQSHMSENYCIVATFFVVLLGFAEFHTVAAISQERLILICYPFLARKWLSPRIVRLVVAIIWLVASFFAIAYVLLVTKTMNLTLTTGSTYRLCTVYYFVEQPNQVSRSYSTFIFVIYNAIPVVILVVNYFLIFKVLVKRSLHSDATKEKKDSFKRVSGYNNEESILKKDHSTNSEISWKVMKERRHLAKMMMAIAFCFAIFNSPVFVSYLFMGWGYKLQKNSIFWLLIVKFLPPVSSLFNPFVYCIRRRTLKRNFISTSLRRSSKLKDSSRY